MKNVNIFFVLIQNYEIKIGNVKTGLSEAGNCFIIIILRH